MTDKKRSLMPLAWYARCCLVFLFLSNPILTVSQQNSIDYLKNAEKEYDELNIEKAINDLNQALSLGLNKEKYQIRAYKLLGTCFAETGDSVNSVSAFRNLLKVDPDFSFHEDISPTIKIPFEQARNEFYSEYSKPKGKSKLLYWGIAGSAVTVTAVALIVSMSGGNGEPGPGGNGNTIEDPILKDPPADPN